MGEPPRSPHFERNALNETLIFPPYYPPPIPSPCGNPWHERSHFTAPHLSSFPTQKQQPMTLREVVWAQISGSRISPSHYPRSIRRMRNRERECPTMSSSPRLQQRSVDKYSVSREEFRTGHGFEYGLMRTGELPFSRPSIMHDANIIIIPRRFFTIVVMLNLIGLILAIEEKWQYPRERTSALCLGNLLAAILVRNELFGRILYLLVNMLFAKVRSNVHITRQVSRVLMNQWTPLWFRLTCTSTLQHLGGIHSGCAISGFAWLVFHLVLKFIHRTGNEATVLFIGVVTCVALAICIASAFPWIRNTHHKYAFKLQRFKYSKPTTFTVCLSDTIASSGGLDSYSVSEGSPKSNLLC